MRKGRPGVMTWKQLVTLEPRLEVVRRKAERHAERIPRLRPSARICANDLWYGTPRSDGLKAEVERLVGYARKDDDRLSTPAAYDLAVRTIYNALPACRNCDCV